MVRAFRKKSIDHFKKFARLGTSLFISDAIISISATMRGKRTSDDLAKSIYRFKDANPDYANSAIARIFSISESTLRGILKRRIVQKKVKLGRKSVLTRRIKRQLLGRVNRVAVQDVLTSAQKGRRVNWCRRHFFTSQKVFSATINYF